jgi:hypothetical protein
MRFSEFENSEIKEHTNYTTKLSEVNALNSEHKDINSSIMKQANLRLNLLNQVNEMAKTMSTKNFELPFPFEFSSTWENFLEFRKSVDSYMSLY